MSLIKFPSNVKPSRVTVNLERRDEMFVSPVTGIQQVASRGNAFWRWTYEFKDISLSERDIVQAFLAKCRGSLNTFKVSDPANYEIRGSVSDWVDIYSGYGSFQADGGSDTNFVNSWFAVGSNSGFSADKILHDISDDQLLTLEWDDVSSSNVYLRWKGHGGVVGRVDSFQFGASYVQRIKSFNGDTYNKSTAGGFTCVVGSSNGKYHVIAGPGTSVISADNITVPFTPNSSRSYLGPLDYITDARIGDTWRYADNRLMRCALLSNSENLIPRSNEFDHAVWSQALITVESGFGEADPVYGVTSGAWRIWTSSSTGGKRLIWPQSAKVMSEDMYTLSIYAKADVYDHIRMSPRGQTADTFANVWFNLTTGSFDQGGFAAGERIIPRMYHVGNSWYRLAVTCISNSNDEIYMEMYTAVDSNVTGQSIGSGGLLICHAQIEKHPQMGHYIETTVNTVVPGSGQTGSTIYASGFNPREKIPAGTRFELVTQFHNETNNDFEQSEFKKLTTDVIAHREGWAVLEFDPPIRNAPKTDRSQKIHDHLGETMHNPVIFTNPEMQARLLGGTVQYIEKPLQLTDVVFEVIEDLSE
jgi:hypothetical protein